MGSTQLDQTQVQVYQHSEINKISTKILLRNLTLFLYIHHVHRMSHLVEHYCPNVHIIGAKHLLTV